MEAILAENWSVIFTRNGLYTIYSVIVALNPTAVIFIISYYFDHYT